MLLPVVFQTASMFLLEGDKCIVAPPCTCQSDNVYCQDKHLNTTPHFLEQPGLSTEVLYLKLYNNNINIIDAEAFQEIHSVNTTNIQIQLQNNKINTIVDDAFAGISQLVTLLNLENNKLSVIPAAIGN